MNKFLRLAAVSFFLAWLAAPMAAVAADGAAEQAIRERIAALEKAWAKGDAAFVATQVYGADAVIQGEGQKETIQTAAGVLDVVQHLVADSRGVQLDIHSVKPLGATAALSWVTWHVTPKAADQKPFDVKALFVWSKGKDGWRIRADMYTFGRM